MSDDKAPPPTPVRKISSISEFYNVGERIGEGRFSEVCAATHIETKEPRAVKIMKQPHAHMGIQEREILRRIKHHNIITLHEVIETPESVYLVLDRMQGDLYTFVRKARRLKEGDAKKVMRALLDAVEHLHQQGIVHRDLKPENILINDHNDVRIADFGLAKVATDINTPVGTSFYMAPEIIRAIEMHTGKRAVKLKNPEEVKYVDMWSLGVILFILLSGTPPFRGKVTDDADRQRLLRQIDRGVLFDERWRNISENAKSLVLGLLTQDIRYRLSARQALQHPWFTAGVSDDREDKESPAQDEQPMEQQEMKEHVDRFQQLKLGPEEDDDEGEKQTPVAQTPPPLVVRPRRRPAA